MKIGRYFHTGRGLTIFSTNYNWRNSKKIPYNEISIEKEVKIEEGAIIAEGPVVTKNVSCCENIGGNPAKVIEKRNVEEFENLKLHKHCVYVT